MDERRRSGVIRFRLVDNASDKPQKKYDFTTGTEHMMPSPSEVQRRFLAALCKDGFEPFDGDDSGMQWWRRPDVQPRAK